MDEKPTGFICFTIITGFDVPLHGQNWSFRASTRCHGKDGPGLEPHEQGHGCRKHIWKHRFPTLKEIEIMFRSSIFICCTRRISLFSSLDHGFNFSPGGVPQLFAMLTNLFEKMQKFCEASQRPFESENKASSYRGDTSLYHISELWTVGEHSP